tara:strand:- start:164 stop:376 length:213 start_codon:yes stop_codon:yes gene_type:complete
MKLEVGDMIVCARDYGIFLEVEDARVTITWFEKNSDRGEAASTQAYWIDSLISTIDGEHNKLVKGSRCSE